MNDLPEQEVAIYNAARRLAPAERAAYLDQACAGDAALRRRLDELLRVDEGAGDFLEKPALADANALAMSGGIIPPALPLSEKPGDRIGPYKLLQQIGEGGCGVVYMAEQEAPIRRRVALKVIKLGMDTKQVIARFEAERQALALMDHPNIARVLDAGATETGRPYFVMELVRGTKITDYCDQQSLPTRARLDLFIKVCQAIQHAHQKGIIHRDIKPSNILVTNNDGVAVPKVIDFGIAKATQGRLTDLTLFTAFEQFIGTPAYMSPEQAVLTSLDVDTRSDIYSVGVLLYELLTGQTPFDSKELLAKGLDEMRRTIREQEPRRPSNRLTTMDEGALTTAANRRQTDPPKLVHLVQGDLDWIVMKCLEKDRSRRYETANGLVFDLRRHLNNEPVLARPPSAAYKFQKAFRRNKLVFCAAAAVFLALVVGVSLAAVGWRQTRVERDKALQAQAGEEAQRKAAQLAEQAAQASEKDAQAQALAARRTAYISDMNLVQQALAANNLGRAQRLLNRQKPQSGQLDLRDWEWRYLWSQSRADEHEVFFAGTNLLHRPLSVSADGRLLAREDQGETVVADLISRHTVLQRTNAWNPVFAHRGTRLAFVVDHRPTNNDSITLLDMATQKETQFELSSSATMWLGLTPDDRMLLTVSLRTAATAADGFPYDLMAWEAETGTQLWQRGIGERRSQNGRSYAISPDGEAFAAVLLGGRVQMLDTRDGRERFTIKTTEEFAITVAFSPDSSTLLTAAGYTDSAIRLWDARTGKAAGSLEGHDNWVSDLVFTPDGKQLISSSADQTIRLWDWSTLKLAGVLRGHLDEVAGLSLAPDGRTLASRCKDGSIYLWDAAKPSRHLGYQTFPSRLIYWPSFTPDSHSLLAVDSGRGVALWDASTLKETRRFWGATTNRHAPALSLDGKWLVRNDGNGHLSVWDVLAGVETTNFFAAPGELTSCGFTDHGKFLATLYGLNTNLALQVWDTSTWRPGISGTLHFTNFNAIFFTPLPNTFVFLADGAFQFFDATRLDAAPKQIKNNGIFSGFEVSPDCRIVAASYEDGSVRLWDMATLQPVETLRGFRTGAHTLSFSPNGRRLAAGSNGQEAVKLWDTDTWQEVLTLSGEGSMFRAIRFSPDGRYLMAINNAGLAHLWFAPTLAEIEAAETAEK